MLEPSTSTGAPYLVGREREQDTLRAALVAALAGRGSLVLIGGEAGIGKTTLAEATLSGATAQGALVLIGRCYDLAETPPYGPWTEALARAPAGEGLPALSVALLPPGRDGATLVGQEAIFRRVGDFLAALSARQTMLLLLDDLHWADPASLDLLRFLARRVADCPLLILATYRTDEVARRHPLHALLPLLVREGRAARLELRRLDEEECRLLVRRYALTQGDEDRLVAYLAGRSEGNPLYAGELLRTLEEEGSLRRDGAGWSLGDLDAAGVPLLLRQVIDARVDRRLGERARELLAVAAIVGQAVPLDVWAAVAAADEETVLDTAERAVEARLLTETPDGTGVRFAHALIRDALYAGMSSLRRRAIHRRAGELLASGPNPDPEAVAHHFQWSGDPRAVDWLERAADRAHRAYAWLTAAERVEAALALTAQRGSTAGERAWLTLRLALLRRHADPPAAADLLATATGLANSAGETAMAICARFNAGQVRCWLGAFQAGVAEMADAMAAYDAAPPDEAIRTWLRSRGLADGPDHYRGTLALWRAYTGHLLQALATGEQVSIGLGTPPPAGWLDGGFAADALRAMGIAHAWLGHPTEARDALERNREAYRATGDHGQASIADVYLLWLVAMPYAADDPAARRVLAAEAAREMALSTGVGGYLEDIQLAALPLLEGDWAAVRTALPAYPTLDRHMRLTYIHALAPLAAYQGDRVLARQMLEELPDGAATSPGDVLYQAGMALLRLAAALALDARDPTAAQPWLEAHDRWLAWSGAVLGRAEGQLDWATYHRARGDLPAAREHAERALAHATLPRQPLALLAAHRLLGELDIAAGHHADARVHLDVALALAEACAAPYERALTLLALVESSLAGGDRSATNARLSEARIVLESLGAAPALARADDLAARLAAPSPPATAPAVALPFGLTAREAAVLRLLSDGLTDPQIADRLFVSRHTINAHRRAIYGKLGVNSRAAATRLALEHHLA